MKKFDISNLIVTGIRDVYSYTLPEDTEGAAVTKNATLIIKSKGCSEYTVDGKEYNADPNTVVFLPKDTAYSIYVDRAGECLIIEFDADVESGATPCEFVTDNDKEVASTAKSLLNYWKLKGPAYHSKCLSELYTLITQISTIHSYTNSLVGKYGLIHKSVKYIEANYYDLDFTIEEIRQSYEHDMTCEGSVPQAIVCFLDSEDFEDAIRNAVSLGGDGDTQACIAGAIAEAFYGVPDEMQEAFEYVDENLRDYFWEYADLLYGRST